MSRAEVYIGQTNENPTNQWEICFGLRVDGTTALVTENQVGREKPNVTHYEESARKAGGEIGREMRTKGVQKYEIFQGQRIECQGGNIDKIYVCERVPETAVVAFRERLEKKWKEEPRKILGQR